ncbi:hypothetical protein CAP31_02575 [Sulfuriferula sp. AH1]|uniref:hypothetical protein n=1 Tax=Sulfuriferula sp. AH1 TaxID=1985873 RepID=UPI000B3B9960|nr:hypothetical protein [Sulfuriferula sp. AH1]ARU30666.1 hypothetical protein CAP31_02575 [Sulfuriferula sp. AH1]
MENIENAITDYITKKKIALNLTADLVKSIVPDSLKDTNENHWINATQNFLECVIEYLQDAGQLTAGELKRFALDAAPKSMKGCIPDQYTMDERYLASIRAIISSNNLL